MTGGGLTLVARGECRLAQFFSANFIHRPRIALDRGPAGMAHFVKFQSCADSGTGREISPAPDGVCACSLSC